MDAKTKNIAAQIATLMPRVARWILFDFFQSVELPQAQLFAMMTLHEAGPCRFSHLCQALRISGPTATGIVDRMEKAGYVVRSHDTEDRRAVNVTLTPEGERLARRFKVTVEDRWAAILDELPAADRAHYLRILKKIHKQLLTPGDHR